MSMRYSHYVPEDSLAALAAALAAPAGAKSSPGEGGLGAGPAAPTTASTSAPVAPAAASVSASVASAAASPPALAVPAALAAASAPALAVPAAASAPALAVPAAASASAPAPGFVRVNHDALRGQNFKYLEDWGAIPAGVSPKAFNKAFNAANSTWINENPLGNVKEARRNGTIAKGARNKLGYQ